jgi:flagellar biosynthesis/type III secretory pathway protein FliH
MAPGFLVSHGRTRLAVAGRIVKARDVARLLEAREVLERCHSARAKLVRTYLRLRERARARGREAGRREALFREAGRLAATELRAARYLGALDHEVIGLVLEVVRRVVPQLDAAAVAASCAAEALKQVRAERWLRIRVHPEVRAKVAARLDALAREHRPPAFARLVDDPELERTACILESEVGQVRADLELQLHAIRAAMLEAAAEVRNAVPGRSPR